MIADFVKRYFVLMLVGALLVGAFILNMKTNEADVDTGSGVSVSVEEPVAVETAGGDYFENFRMERQAVRELEMEYLDEVISASASDDETLADANRQKLSLVENMEKEFTIESLVKAKGFEDAAVTLHSGTVNVVVRHSGELSGEQVAQILDIARKETGEKAANIKVMAEQ